MSKKTIKRQRLKRKKRNPFLLNAMLGQQGKELSEKVKADREDVINLIVAEELDPYRIEDYKYVKSIALKLDWPVNRLFKAIEAANVKEIVENERKETENNNGSQES